MCLSFFSSTWCRGLAAVCDCGIPWTFLLNLLSELKTDKDAGGLYDLHLSCDKTFNKFNALRLFTFRYCMWGIKESIISNRNERSIQI